MKTRTPEARQAIVESAINQALDQGTLRLDQIGDVTPQPAQPAPCARHCEANAFQVTIRGLQGDMERLMDKHNALHINAKRHRDDNARLLQAIQKTIDENGHLADGDNCTLIDLVNAVKGQPAQQRQPLTEATIDEFLEDYEMVGETEDGNHAYYTPNENEKALIKDAMMGLLDVVQPAAQPAQRQPLTLNEMTAIEEGVYMQTTHKGKPSFEYAQALIRAAEAAHGIGAKP